jgi:hypothetical protein
MFLSIRSSCAKCTGFRSSISGAGERLRCKEPLPTGAGDEFSGCEDSSREVYECREELLRANLSKYPCRDMRKGEVRRDSMTAKFYSRAAWYVSSIGWLVDFFFFSIVD